MVVKFEIYNFKTGEVVDTRIFSTDSLRRALDMINEGEDEEVRYIIAETPEQEDEFWAMRENLPYHND